MSFNIVEHTADVRVELRAPDLAGLLVSLTHAVRHLYAGSGSRSATSRGDHRLRARTPEELLVRWANHLIFLFDARGELALDAEIAGLEGDDEGFEVVVRLEFRPMIGTDFMPENDLKAATYHGLEVRSAGDGGLTACLVMDT